MCSFQPVFKTFHSAHIVRHILPRSAQRDFKTWLKALVGRIKSHSRKPDEPFRKKKNFATSEDCERFVARHREAPVSPQILDPAFDYQETDRIRLVADFLARLNPQINRYLRSSENMLALGFEGVPYQLS